MKKELKPYYNKLLKKKQEFLEKYESNKDISQKEEKEGTGDLVDQATDDYTNEFLNNLSAADLKILRLIDSAIERIQKDDYGVCQDCGEDISPKRLKAVPWAEFCLNCQEKKEKEEE